MNDGKVKKLENDLEEKIKEATVKLNDFKRRFDLVNTDEKWWKITSNEIVNEREMLIEHRENLKNSIIIHDDLNDLKFQTRSFQFSEYQNKGLNFFTKVSI